MMKQCYQDLIVNIGRLINITEFQLSILMGRKLWNNFFFFFFFLYQPNKNMYGWTVYIHIYWLLFVPYINYLEKILRQIDIYCSRKNNKELKVIVNFEILVTLITQFLKLFKPVQFYDAEYKLSLHVCVSRIYSKQKIQSI